MYPITVRSKILISNVHLEIALRNRAFRIADKSHQTSNNALSSSLALF